MASVLVGEIGVFAFGYVPLGWAYCNGQSLPIERFKALYAVIGTTYGGDGLKTFALPNFNGRVAVNAGQGPNCSSYEIGETAGADTVALEDTHLPQHFHVLVGGEVTPFNLDQNTATPGGTALFSTSSPRFLYTSTNDYKTGFTAEMTDTTGLGTPHLNDQPSLTLSICMAFSNLG